MKLGELAGAGHSLPDDMSRVDICGLTADSRDVSPGFLFAALPGTQTDGAKFIPQALENGAAAILVPQDTSLPAKEGLAVIEEPDARRAFALMAARFFARQPDTIVAVTGTSGKSSIVSYVRQLWQALGHQAASLGTIGIETPSGMKKGGLTTPDPVLLHRELAELADEGVTHLALEASSHGLQQRRLDGVWFAAAAFTNLSRDHLDYHPTFEDYLAQKLRLFRTLLPEGASVVVNADSDMAGPVAAAAKERSLPLITVGQTGDTLRLLDVERDGFSQHLRVEHEGGICDVTLPLVGEFQASNALVAAGLCMACGAEAGDILPLMEELIGAKGRLELVGTSAKGAPVFVDYAHKPDALAKVLDALRPYAQGRLAVVFGCGGDRDKGKRPEMGQIAGRKADVVIVTDDNPRGEDPAAIRAEILETAPTAREIADRGKAIETAISELEAGDILVIAGKGHEKGQVVGDTVLPFSDHEAATNVLGQGAAT
ncbi:MAG: UDP-N-acetylmuramoyl-L-alanyl-D-glutamate--2,6-diaminopimelate ligase [Hyphomicrobiaceae bacterium]|nr:UDP-N-acetylmuramoyl-L-alanyl-D-glutamate--2,6-diaminopimelate ligase [Hyphomicrobiaceae bacterium]